MVDFWNELPEPKFLDSRIHPGIPMGFLKWGNEEIVVTKRGRPKKI